MRRHYDEFRRLGAEVLVVSQARPDLLAVFLREDPLPFPAVADPTRAAYRAFGLETTTWAAMLRPGVILGYLRFIFRGWRPQPAHEGEDVLQLGGDFVLDREGRLRYAYRSEKPTDRPSVEVLLRAVHLASGETSSPARGYNQK